MLEEIKHGAGCSEFEALLMDALEGQLSGARKESFEAHRRVCALCGPMFADVQAGQQWLRALEPVEPPAYLLHNILAATSGVASTRRATSAAGQPAMGGRLREWWDSWVRPAGAFVQQPRFVMSFGMIFFSFSLALSAAGVKASDVSKISLRPAALRHTYNDAQIKVVKYYDNIRFVYEIESKVRELKRAATPAEPGPPEKKENRNNNNTSEEPNRKQDRNYSEEQGRIVMAGLTEEPATRSELRATNELVLAQGSQHVARSCFPVVTVTMNRRYV